MSRSRKNSTPNWPRCSAVGSPPNDSAAGDDPPVSEELGSRIGRAARRRFASDERRREISR